MGRLRCLRGVSTLTAFALCVEIGDFRRLSGRTIGASLGLVPTEQQSGARHSRGPITKAGNRHARRLLVEAAWHQRRPPLASAEIERRRAGQSAPVRARAEQAARRLHRRWTHLERRRGLRSRIVATALARELAGWCWSLAVMDEWARWVRSARRSAGQDAARGDARDFYGQPDPATPDPRERPAPAEHPVMR